MLKRIKQVFAALTANIDENDKKFINSWLTAKEKELFWAMNLPDQRHALNVTYTALKLKDSKGYRINQEKLIKCCLLHDIGKVRGDVSTFDKIMAVLAYHFVPQLAKSWQKYGKGNALQNLRHALYIYDHHAKIGYEKLMLQGNSEIARLIVKHHEQQMVDDSVELLLLREADELN